MSEIETVFSKSGMGYDWISINSIQVPNRAMSFGDGLFETMVYDNNQIQFLDHHLARLTNGMKILNLGGEAVDILELESFLRMNFQSKKLRI